MQCLQVDELFCGWSLSPAVYSGFGRCGSQRFGLVALLFDGCIKSIQVVVFSKATILQGLHHQPVGIAH